MRCLRIVHEGRLSPGKRNPLGRKRGVAWISRQLGEDLGLLAAQGCQRLLLCSKLSRFGGGGIGKGTEPSNFNLCARDIPAAGKREAKQRRRRIIAFGQLTGKDGLGLRNAGPFEHLRGGTRGRITVLPRQQGEVGRKQVAQGAAAVRDGRAFIDHGTEEFGGRGRITCSEQECCLARPG